MRCGVPHRADSVTEVVCESRSGVCEKKSRCALCEELPRGPLIVTLEGVGDRHDPADA